MCTRKDTLFCQIRDNLYKMAFTLQISAATLLQGHQGVLAELVGELLLHLENLAGPGVVPERPGHFLVGHRPLVAFPLTPQRCHQVLVRGGKAENPRGGRHPGHAVGHRRVLQHLKQKVKQAHLSTCNH